MTHPKLTFGLIVDQISSLVDYEFFQNLIISGITDFTKNHEINLVSFVTGKINSPYEWERSRNILLEFIDPSLIDGLIVLTNAINTYVDDSFIRVLLKKYEGIPIVSIGEKLDPYPSVETSGYSAMYKMIEHLISEHGCRKLVFIKGADSSQEARQRLRAYLDVLNDYGIPYDPTLVFEGDYQYDAGEKTVRLLVQRQLTYDAIVSANDNMALGAVDELRRQYGTLPNIPIVGFDDAFFAKQLGLTTIRQNFQEQGRLAAETLYRIIRGEQVPLKQEIPSDVLIRSTCGCIPSMIANTLAPSSLAENSLSIAIMKQQLAEALRQIHNDYLKDTSDTDSLSAYEQELADSFIEETVESHNSSFYYAWERYVVWFAEREERSSILHDILSSFRRSALSLLSDPKQLRTAENLFQATRVQIGLTVNRLESSSYLLSSLHTAQLERFSEELFGELDMKQQMDIISMMLPRYGIMNAYIILYEDADKPMKQARLIMAIHDGKRMDTGEQGISFPTKQMLPEAYIQLLKQQRSDHAVLALHHGDIQLGYAIFRFNRKLNRHYELIRHRLSVSLKSAILMRAEKDYSQQMEQQVALRTQELTETNRKLLVEVERRLEAEVKLRAAMEELRALSIRDELTGLLNRRGFMERGKRILEEAKVSGETYLVMFADMDKLKSINDQFGHDEGDHAIAHTASLLVKHLPKSSVIARLGGDEFTAIIPVQGVQQPELTIRQVLSSAVDEHNLLSGLPYSLSISMGFILYRPDVSISLDEVMKQADDKLYSEKRAKQR